MPDLSRYTSGAVAASQKPIAMETVASARNMANPVTLILPQQNAPLVTPEQVMQANGYPLPKSITLQVSSAAGAGATATTVFLLNQNLLNNITDNGSGAGSITYVSNDGFSGNLVSEILAGARANMGAVCYGLAVRMNVIAGGAGDPAGLAAANPVWLANNAFGRSTPLDFNSTDNQTRMDQDDSIQIWTCVQNVGRFVQLGLTVPVADTATVTLYFDPNSVPR